MGRRAARCDRCGRKTWTDDAGCTMTQPSGLPCGGTFRTPDRHDPEEGPGDPLVASAQVHAVDRMRDRIAELEARWRALVARLDGCIEAHRESAAAEPADAWDEGYLCAMEALRAYVDDDPEHPPADDDA